MGFGHVLAHPYSPTSRIHPNTLSSPQAHVAWSAQKHVTPSPAWALALLLRVSWWNVKICKNTWTHMSPSIANWESWRCRTFILNLQVWLPLFHFTPPRLCIDWYCTKNPPAAFAAAKAPISHLPGLPEMSGRWTLQQLWGDYWHVRRIFKISL